MDIRQGLFRIIYYTSCNNLFKLVNIKQNSTYPIFFWPKVIINIGMKIPGICIHTCTHKYIYIYSKHTHMCMCVFERKKEEDMLHFFQKYKPQYLGVSCDLLDYDKKNAHTLTKN